MGFLCFLHQLCSQISRWSLESAMAFLTNWCQQSVSGQKRPVDIHSACADLKIYILTDTWECWDLKGWSFRCFSRWFESCISVVKICNFTRKKKKKYVRKIVSYWHPGCSPHLSNSSFWCWITHEVTPTGPFRVSLETLVISTWLSFHVLTGKIKWRYGLNMTCVV